MTASSPGRRTGSLKQQGQYMVFILHAQRPGGQHTLYATVLSTMQHAVI